MPENNQTFKVTIEVPLKITVEGTAALSNESLKTLREQTKVFWEKLFGTTKK